MLLPLTFKAPTNEKNIVAEILLRKYVSPSARERSICSEIFFASEKLDNSVISQFPLLDRVGVCLCSLFFPSEEADYMANFSPVSRAEITARFPEQIFLKRRL